MNNAEELAKFCKAEEYEKVAQYIDSWADEVTRGLCWGIAVQLAMAGTTADQMVMYGIRQVRELVAWDHQRPDPVNVAQAWCAVHNAIAEAGPVAAMVVAAVRDCYRR